MNKILKRVLIAVSALVVIGVTSTVLLIYLAFGSTIEEIPFEENSWKTGTNRAQMKFPRQPMVDTLSKSNILLDKSEKEIISMLGEPDSKYYENNMKTYGYFIGPDRRLASADNEWLKIYLNSNNIVVKNELVVH